MKYILLTILLFPLALQAMDNDVVQTGFMDHQGCMISKEQWEQKYCCKVDTLVGKKLLHDFKNMRKDESWYDYRQGNKLTEQLDRLSLQTESNNN